MYRSVYWYFHLLDKRLKESFVHKASQIFKQAVQDKKITMDLVKETSPYFEILIKNPKEFLQVVEKGKNNKSPLIVPR